ncbi:AraC family transcriptional regulator, partial [Bordetella hinzii]|nr:AraC family transcriptional regulator [Bordetella hinzii]
PALKENALIELVAKLHGAPAQILSHPRTPRGLSGLIAVLREQAAAPPALGELARQAGMSRYQLIRTFRKLTGLPPHAWILDQRIIQAREHLRAGRPLAEVALELGFADQSHFQRVFKAHTATTPGHYRAAG